MVKKLIGLSFFILLSNFELKSQSKLTRDSLINICDLNKVKSLEALINYQNDCKVFEYQFTY